MAGKTKVQVSTSVGDAAPDAPLAELVNDLARITHERAAEHYLWSVGCKWDGFTGAPGDGRAEFEARMRFFYTPEETIALHLGQWDGAQRPIAVVHWAEAGPADG